MKPAAFAYLRPDSIPAALEALARHGPDARVLAGGQSLMPMMALRVAQPAVLVDIGRIQQLRGIHATPTSIQIGALMRHAELLGSAVVAERLPLITLALPHVAHAAIRNRGTLGGSLALADPAAEMPACALALDAVMHIAGQAGRRSVAASDFFQGLYTTAVQDGEILASVEFPAAIPGDKPFFDEVSRRRGDYAIAGLAAVRKAKHEVRLALLGCGDRPQRAPKTESLVAEALNRGQQPVRSDIRDALRADLDPPSDLQADADTRLHLAAVLVERASKSWLKGDTP